MNFYETNNWTNQQDMKHKKIWKMYEIFLGWEIMNAQKYAGLEVLNVKQIFERKTN